MKKTLLIAALSLLTAGQSMAQMTIWTKGHKHISIYDSIAGTYTDRVDTISVAHPYRLSEVDSIVIAPRLADFPKVKPQEGKVTILWHIVKATVCAELVFAGDYNGWNTDLDSMARFEPVEGFADWYKAVITPTAENDGYEGAVLQGVPCQLDVDGAFSWGYQWMGTDAYPLRVLSGGAYLVAGYGEEKSLAVTTNSSVVVVESNAFKEDPCVPRTYADIAFTVTTPALSAGYTLYIAGGLNDWTAEPLTPNADRTVWTLTKEHVRTDNGYAWYKYLLNGEWTYVELGKTTAEGCANGIANRTITGTLINDVVENFNNVTVNQCE